MRAMIHRFKRGAIPEGGVGIGPLTYLAIAEALSKKFSARLSCVLAQITLTPKIHQTSSLLGMNAVKPSRRGEKGTIAVYTGGWSNEKK